MNFVELEKNLVDIVNQKQRNVKIKLQNLTKTQEWNKKH